MSTKREKLTFQQLAQRVEDHDLDPALAGKMLAAALRALEQLHPGILERSSVEIVTRVRFIRTEVELFIEVNAGPQQER